MYISLYIIFEVLSRSTIYNFNFSYKTPILSLIIFILYLHLKWFNKKNFCILFQPAIAIYILKYISFIVCNHRYFLDMVHSRSLFFFFLNYLYTNCKSNCNSYDIILFINKVVIKENQIFLLIEISLASAYAFLV